MNTYVNKRNYSASSGACKSVNSDGLPPLVTAWKWMKTSSLPSSGAM